MGASPMFWVPGAREICLWMGAVDARKKTAERVLTDASNLSMFVYPGGSKEIFLTDPKSLTQHHIPHTAQRRNTARPHITDSVTTSF